MNKKAFAERLEKVVALAGGQAELARRSGVSLRAIGDYLRAKTMPRDYIVTRLADGGGVRFEWLLKNDGAMRGGTQLVEERRAGYFAINSDTLTLVIGAVELLLPGYAPMDRANVIALAYEYMTAKRSSDRDVLAAFLRQWAKSALAQPKVPDFHSPEVTGVKDK